MEGDKRGRGKGATREEGQKGEGTSALPKAEDLWHCHRGRGFGQCPPANSNHFCSHMPSQFIFAGRQRQSHRIAASARVSSGWEESQPKRAEEARGLEMILKLTGFTHVFAYTNTHHTHTRAHRHACACAHTGSISTSLPGGASCKLNEGLQEHSFEEACPCFGPAHA